MVSALKEENALSLKFGGGLHTRASEEDINLREAHEGQNFDLDFENQQLRNRKAFDLLGTAPNGSEIRGGATLLNVDGTVTMLVQAGDIVYEWDGSSFTSKGTVNAAAKLRGRREANSELDDLVIITDINLSEPVMTWNGTTLSTMAHNLTGDFLAKYCFIANERAFYGNVISNAVATPHMIVGATRGDYTTLSVSTRPASGLSEGDPFFLLTPDLRAINGIVEAFGIVAFSSRKGSMFKLTGSSAKDFAIAELYPGSGASGDESMAYVGNDILYGRAGRIESLTSTDQFGDVATDDLSKQVVHDIDGYTGWTTIYNDRLNRTYFFPDTQAECWVFHPDMASVNLSPWSKWTTQHSSSFQPTFVMDMLDPVDGLKYVYFGDSAGNFFRLEGSSAGDAGSAGIKTRFRSRLFSAPMNQELFGIEGFVKYRVNEAFTMTIRLLYAGTAIFTEVITVSAVAASRPVYGGSLYYNDGNYYASQFAGRLQRQPLAIAGKSNEFQIEVEVEGTTDFEINEILLRFEGAF